MLELSGRNKPLLENTCVYTLYENEHLFQSNKKQNIFHLRRINLACSSFDFLEKELDSKVDNLDATEDGETSEESHCASNKTQLGDQGHLG